VKYSEQSQDYKRGYVEGSSLEGERDCYLLETGCTDIAEYNRGFADGKASGGRETAEVME
jgi:hypothetical protein